jgi:hypothetical protein
MLLNEKGIADPEFEVFLGNRPKGEKWMRCPTRRSFLGAAAAIPLASSAQTSPAFRKRVHPLEGIARENLKIQDARVTIMSYPLPPDRQWITGRAVTWKTDLILIEIQTDKGITGIGETHHDFFGILQRRVRGQSAGAMVGVAWKVPGSSRTRFL